MNKSLASKIIGIIIILLFVVILDFSGLLNINNAAQVITNTKSEPVTIKFMSNLPDRTNGQGKIEQMLADKYTEEHPNVKIQFETLQDVAFQQKFKVYVSLDNVPDIYMTWSGPEFDLAAKVSEELNPEDFKDYGFNPGAIETRKKNGKLYGIPKDNNMYLLYYNKDIFIKNHIKIPETFQELLEVSKKFRKLGIIPCVTNGKDKWELSGLNSDLYYKVNPDPQKYADNWDKADRQSDPFELKALGYYKQLMDVGFFQDYFANTDYGTAKSIFTNGKAAMYYMGTWELSMVSDLDLPVEFRSSLSAMIIPPIVGESKDNSVLTKWYGGGYSVYKNSKVKKEAVEFLKYFFKPENWAQLVWDNGVCISTQSFKLDGNETSLMKSVYNILVKTDKYKGNYPLLKQGDSFVLESRDILQKFCLGLLTPEEYLREIDKGISKSIEAEIGKN